jgi:hypothetical protein
LTQRHHLCYDLPAQEPIRLLVPPDLSVFSVCNFLLTRLSLLDCQALFIMVKDDRGKGVFPSLTASVEAIARVHRSGADGYLHFVYSSENCFG